MSELLLLDVLDCANPELVEKRLKLYSGYGFASLPSNELRLFLAVGTVRTLLAEAAEDSPSGSEQTVG